MMSPSSPVSPPIAAIHGTFDVTSPVTGTPSYEGTVTEGYANGRLPRDSTGDIEWDMFLDSATGQLKVAAGADIQPWSPANEPVCPFSGQVVRMEMAYDRAKRLRATRNTHGSQLAISVSGRTIAQATQAPLIKFVPVRLLSPGCTRLPRWQLTLCLLHIGC